MELCSLPPGQGAVAVRATWSGGERRGVLGLVERQRAAAAHLRRDDRAPSCPLRFIDESNAFAAQVGDRALKVVAHEAELGSDVVRGGMSGELGRW
jgi:hypothetical protein